MFLRNLLWENVFFFGGDERHVPPEDPESNYRMANESLLSKLPIPADHVFRIQSERPDAGVGAQAYEQTLRDFFRPAPGSFPRFDQCFLFPGTTALEERRHFLVANWVEKFSTFRITLTFPVLNHAACVIFLANGSDKAEMVGRALTDPGAKLPCQRIRPDDGELIWFLDQEAAARL